MLGGLTVVAGIGQRGPLFGWRGVGGMMDLQRLDHRRACCGCNALP